MIVAAMSFLLFQSTASRDIKAEFDKALVLWREFGRPVEKIHLQMTDDLAYPNLHFHAGATLSEALPLADSGKYVEAEAVIKKERAINGQGFDSFDDQWLGKRVDDSYEARTAMLVYKHLVNHYLDMKPAEEVLKQLMALRDRKLIKSTARSTFGEARSLLDTFIDELRLTMSPTGSVANTPEAAVDQLVQVKVSYVDRHGTQRSTANPAQYKDILGFGLDAIEPLLANLESKKLTRTFSIGMMRSPSQILTVPYFVEDLILKIANGDLGDRESGRLTKELVRSWMQAKKKGKVEDWLMSNLYIEDRELGNYCNYRSFVGLALAHPHLLGKAFRVIRAAKADPHLALAALDKAMLTEREKKDIRLGKASGG